MDTVMEVLTAHVHQCSLYLRLVVIRQYSDLVTSMQHQTYIPITVAGYLLMVSYSNVEAVIMHAHS